MMKDKYNGERIRAVISEPNDLKVIELSSKLNTTVTSLVNMFVSVGLEVLERSSESIINEIETNIKKELKDRLRK